MDRYGLESVGVVPHGITVRRPEPVAAPAEPEVLMFGVNRANKGLAVLVEALGLLPHPPRLALAGETAAAERASTSALLSSLDDVRWIDRYVDERELLALTSTATAFVLPYLGFEAQSGVLHLAIETATPVVVSDSGDMAEVVEAFGLGLVVPSGDPASLARAIGEIADPVRNTRLRARMAFAQEQLGWPAAGRAMLDELAKAGG
jgi:glycosyltransferase involved in cell wall biosynthesis